MRKSVSDYAFITHDTNLAQCFKGIKVLPDRTTKLHVLAHITIVYWAYTLTGLGAVYALHLLVTHF
jgi:ABC-type uncharacterized transport system permease subunit